MYKYVILIEFIFATFTGILCTILIAIQGREKLAGNKVRGAIVMLTVSITIIGALMLTLYMREAFSYLYDTHVILRVIDYFLYAFLLYCWLDILQGQFKESDLGGKELFFKTGKALSIIFSIVFSAFTAVFMNDTYHIANENNREIYHMTELAFGILAVAVLCVCTCIAFLKISDVVGKIYILPVSFLMIAYYISQTDAGLRIGMRNVLHWSSSSDISGWILGLVNIMSCFYVCRTGFYHVRKNTETNNDLVSVLDKIAEVYKLTDREREITEIIYMGASNNDIAEKLHISLSTVKSHVHNIFEKTEVNSRTALIHIINDERSKK